MLADGLPALTLALGLVPAAALVLVAASRSDRPSPRATRSRRRPRRRRGRPARPRRARRDGRPHRGAPRDAVVVLRGRVAAHARGRLAGDRGRRGGGRGRGGAAAPSRCGRLGCGARDRRRAGRRAVRGCVDGADGLVGSGATAEARTSATVVLRDGSLALGFVAATAAVVAGWCAVAAWRRLARWALPPAAELGAAQARARRRRLVACGDGRRPRGRARRHRRDAGGGAGAGAGRGGRPGARGVRGAVARRRPGPWRSHPSGSTRCTSIDCRVARRRRPGHVARRDRAAHAPCTRST